jgi:hypothetical protein
MFTSAQLQFLEDVESAASACDFYYITTAKNFAAPKGWRLQWDGHLRSMLDLKMVRLWQEGRNEEAFRTFWPLLLIARSYTREILEHGIGTHRWTAAQLARMQPHYQRPDRIKKAAWMIRQIRADGFLVQPRDAYESIDSVSF